MILINFNHYNEFRPLKDAQCSNWRCTAFKKHLITPTRYYYKRQNDNANARGSYLKYI